MKLVQASWVDNWEGCLTLNIALIAMDVVYKRGVVSVTMDMYDHVLPLRLEQG